MSKTATIVGGPIEMRDYEYLVLAVDHDAVMPDGTTVRVPAGTKLYTLSQCGVVHQRGGTANKAG